MDQCLCGHLLPFLPLAVRVRCSISSGRATGGGPLVYTRLYVPMQELVTPGDGCTYPRLYLYWRNTQIHVWHPFHPRTLFSCFGYPPTRRGTTDSALPLNGGTLTSSSSSTQRQRSSRNWWRWNQEARNSVTDQCCKKH